MMAYLSYEEPRITVLLSLVSFLLLLNGVRHFLDHSLYCGIIGEILIGVIWGLPVGGTAWLAQGTQEAIQAFGYLGLIGLVFEGGLGTDLALLKKSAYLSVSVATIGLLMPIAMSFILLTVPFSSHEGILYPTPIAAFSAGASLCSTSLGTIFAILSASSMQKTRVGVVLVGAAMMDDVVGLVMVNIITTLGSGETTGWPIARPIAASFGLLLVTLVLAPFGLKPIVALCLHRTDLDAQSSVSGKNLLITFVSLIHRIPHLGFILSTSVLLIFVTIAAFIDASLLFAAFIAGGLVNYLWDFQRLAHPSTNQDSSSIMYEKYYKTVMDFLLIPFFFVSRYFYFVLISVLLQQELFIWKCPRRVPSFFGVYMVLCHSNFIKCDNYWLFNSPES
jgi:Kef-type K+ transport system membrane component KefB